MSRSLRLSFVLSSLALSGGVRVVVEFANRLAARGHRVTLVAPRDSQSAEIVNLIAPNVTVCESRLTLAASFSTWGRVRLVWALARTIPAGDFIVSTHTPTTIATLLADRFWRRGRPLWLFQDYAEMFRGRWLESILLRHALRWHLAALTVSHVGVTELRSYRPAYATADIRYIGEGFNSHGLFRPTRAERRLDPITNLLYLGDGRPRKGFADVTDALRRLLPRYPALTLTVVSKEPLAAADDLPLRVVLRPDDATLAALYQTADLFVSASWGEGFGLPPLEAMACGTPVVLTDSGGVREYARDGVNCLLTPPRDPAALAATIERLIINPVLARSLAEAGLETASRFDWPSAVERFEAVLCDLARSPYF